MKINRWIALTFITLFIVAAMGVIAVRSSAMDSHHSAASLSTVPGICAQEEADKTEATTAADTDKVELQCGDQNDTNQQEPVDDVEPGVEAPETTAP